jgi:hypothetical protein
VLLARSGSKEGGPPRPSAGSVRGFAIVAAVIGFAPILPAAVLSLSQPRPYYAFPGLPFALLALATFVPQRVGRRLAPAIASLVFLQAWSSGWRTPDLATVDGWTLRRWDAAEARRLSAVGARLDANVRDALSDAPGDAIVLYRDIPTGSFYQTEDGPATRLALGRPRTRAYFIGEATMDMPLERIVLARFDFATWRLVRETASHLERASLAFDNIIAGRLGSACAWTASPLPEERNEFNFAYLRSAAHLVGEGPDAYVNELARSGLDSTGTRVAEIIERSFGQGPVALREAFARTLRFPRSAEAHVAMANELSATGATRAILLELRIATALDPGREDLRQRYERARDATALENVQRSGTTQPKGAAASIR